jgi:hypothetical protein
MRDRIGSARVTAGKPANGHTGGPALTKSPCGSGVVDEREHKNKRKKRFAQQLVRLTGGSGVIYIKISGNKKRTNKKLFCFYY